MNCSRPFFRAGAYTESDNAPRLKKRSGNARLRYKLAPEINNILVSGRKENKFYGSE